MDHQEAQDIVLTIPDRFAKHWEKWIGEHQTGLEQAEDIATYNREHGIVDKPGPLFLPRNRMLEAAIQEAEQRANLDPYLELLAAVADPYNPEAGPEWMKAPEGAFAYTTFCGT